MATLARWFAGMTALVVAFLLHAFYVDYEVDADQYLLGWAASDAQVELVADREARRLVRPDRVYSRLNDHRAEKWDFVQRFCEPTERYLRLSKWDRPFAPDPNDNVYWRCSKKYVVKDETPIRVVERGVTYEEARDSVERALAQRSVRFGMVPSATVAGDEPSRTSFVKCYWLGIITPIVLVAFSILLFIWAVRGRKGREAARTAHSTVGVTSTPVGKTRIAPEEILGAPEVVETPSHRSTLADLLKDDLGQDYPVGGGDGTEGSPLIITETRDYVGVEYAVVRHVLAAMGEDYKLNLQGVSNQGDRVIDELVFDVKKSGAQSWEGRRRFYFDITAGFGAL